jgi:hypothetical protein
MMNNLAAAPASSQGVDIKIKEIKSWSGVSWRREKQLCGSKLEETKRHPSTFLRHPIINVVFPWTRGDLPGPGPTF